MKTVFKLLGRLLLILIIGILAALAFFWVKNQLHLGSTDEENIAYLQGNKLDISPLDPDGFSFPDDFYQQQVFLLGETHGSADVQLLDEMLLKHLNKKIGVRYYIAEMDSAHAHQLNTFLAAETKDSDLLKEVVKGVGRRIPQQASQGLFDKWMAVYDYNQQLADSLRIQVIGVDRDFSDRSRKISRDSAMLVNFKKAVETYQLQDEPFYGLFGFTHVLQGTVKKQANFTPFAAKLKASDLPFADKVASIVCFNVDGEMRLPATPQFPGPADEKTALLSADGPIVLVQGINDLKAVTEENSLTLFDIQAEGSPYRSSQQLMGLKVNFLGGNIYPANETVPTTEYFQYVILSRNSEALTKLQ